MTTRYGASGIDAVEQTLALYAAAQEQQRYRHSEWKRIADYCLPWQSKFWAGSQPPPADTSASEDWDPVGTQALDTHVGRLIQATIPAGQVWHTLTPPTKRIAEHRDVQIYASEVNDAIFRTREDPEAGFEENISAVYQSLVAYGAGVLFVGKRPPTVLAPGVRYQFCPLYNSFLLLGWDGKTSIFFFRFFLNARQFSERFPSEPLPEPFKRSTRPTEGDTREFVHCVWRKPAGDWSPAADGLRRWPVGGRYFDREAKQFVGREHGYISMPYLTPRLNLAESAPYGRGRASLALPPMALASVLRRDIASTARSHMEPPLLAPGRDVLNDRVDLRPNAVNYGGMDERGNILIKPFLVGDINTPQHVLDRIDHQTRDAFQVNEPSDTTRRSAAEVLEMKETRATDRMRSLFPIQTRLLGPLIEREIALAQDLGHLPKMPATLHENGGRLRPVFTAPALRMKDLAELSAFMRTLEVLSQVVQITGSQAPFDTINFDVALPEFARRLGVHPDWLNSEKQIRALREARAQQQEQQAAVAAAPAAAGILKTVNAMGGVQ